MLVEDAGARITAVTEQAGQRVAAVGRAVRQRRTDAADGCGLKRRAVVAATPRMNGFVGTRLGNRSGVQRRSDGGIHLGFKDGEIVVGADREGVCGKFHPIVEPYPQCSEGGDVFGGHDANDVTVHADDRPGADAMHGAVVGENNDAAVAAAAGSCSHAWGQQGKGEAQGAHKHPRGGRHRFVSRSEKEEAGRALWPRPAQHAAFGLRGQHFGRRCTRPHPTPRSKGESSATRITFPD